jgi:hypothetical protein
MQNTRLTVVFDVLVDRLTGWAKNPWRRLSLIGISLLLGNFLATIVSTVAGQRGNLDVIVAFFLVVVTEVISWLRYVWVARSPSVVRWNTGDLLNGLKLGFIYGLCVEALKLGS